MLSIVLAAFCMTCGGASYLLEPRHWVGKAALGVAFFASVLVIWAGRP